MNVVETLGTGILLSTAVIGAGVAVERLWPAAPVSAAGVVFNTVYSWIALVAHGLLSPVLGAVTTVGIGALGGGLIRLPTAGLGLVAGSIVYIFSMDFAEYVFHRAQHRIQFLWRLHSFHHSDDMFNVSTTLRHHWLDQILKMVTIYAIVGFIFKPAQITLGVYVVMSYLNFFNHMNVDVGLGKWSFLLNTPRYHRLHHSRQAEHYDTNFAAMFPIFDLVCGAYKVPEAGACPPTGLDAVVPPRRLWRALIWPLARQPRASDALAQPEL